MDCSLTGFSVHRISQARILEYWSGLPFPPPGDLPDSGSNPCLLCLLHWQVDYFITALPAYSRQRELQSHRLQGRKELGYVFSVCKPLSSKSVCKPTLASN